MKEKRTIDEMTDTLSTYLKRHTLPSKCVDNFCHLLKNVKSYDAKWTVIKDFNDFVEELQTVIKAVDQISELKIKARMLQESFINSKKFFKKTQLNLERLKQAQKDLGVTSKEVSDIALLFSLHKSVSKALISTKRRSLGLDTNSKRFSEEEAKKVYSRQD